jgi:hypothetical protein
MAVTSEHVDTPFSSTSHTANVPITPHIIDNTL